MSNSGSKEVKKNTKSTQGTKKNSAFLSILYTNADQFINKRDDMLAVIAGQEPDIILIAEVIPKSQSNPIPPSLLHMDGYNPCFNFNPSDENLGRSGIRGVAIYSKISLTVSEIEIKIPDCRDHAWIEVSSGKESVLVGCVYRSPSDDSSKENSRASAIKMIDLISAACRMNPNIVIVGDFNYKEIDWINEYAPPDKQHQTLFIEAIQDNFLHQHVTEPTRFRENETPNLLDLVFSAEESSVKDLEYLPPLGESDHMCLKFKVSFNIQPNTIPTSKQLNIYKTDYDSVRRKLRSHDWEAELNSTFEEDYQLFFDMLRDIKIGVTPLKKPPREKKNIYMTKEAERLRSNKNRLWRKFCSTRSTYDHRNYKREKNKLRALSRQLRSDFEKELSRHVKDKPKMFWKYAKSRLKNRERIPSLTTGGNKYTTPKEKAEALNKFFVSVFTKEDVENIPESPSYNVGEVLTTLNITPEIVLRKLKGLNPNKTPGHDRWHPYFLREIADDICVPLSILFNKSLKEGAHSSWLKAVITAIYKKGVKSDPGNYRPVSMTSVISKIMESIIRDAIVEHLVKNNLLNDDQHGFVPLRDCITQLLLCIEIWTELIEENHAFDVIYTDFAKAFDSVPHERLFVKLASLGIQGDILGWIKSFLRGRTQCVNVDGEKSGWRDVLSGIPQGSVIGPILFVIFINDMPDEVKFNMCKLFADDCKLYGVVEKNVANTMQHDLDRLQEWSTRWQLPFNAKKCKAMHFGANNPHRKYRMDEHILEVTDQEKDLGVMIDPTLKFHVHTSAATKKANQILGVVKKTYTTRDATSISTLYTSMVRPHLEYGNAIWGPFYVGDAKSVEAVQRRATKLIPELKNLPYESRLKALKLPSLVYRRKRGDMIQVYKIVNGMVRINKEDFFRPLRLEHTRGHKQRIAKDKATKAVRLNAFSQRVINDWNSLPERVIEAESLNVFKNRLDDFWSDKKFVTIDD